MILNLIIYIYIIGYIYTHIFGHAQAPRMEIHVPMPEAHSMALFRHECRRHRPGRHTGNVIVYTYNSNYGL
jgi:hypothetical protein